MGDMDLGIPMPTASLDVVFAEATPEQAIIFRKLNSDSWSKPLTLAQYMEAGELLSHTELARNGSIKFWVLHKKSDPLEVVAGCETVRKTVFIREPRLPGTTDAEKPVSIEETTAFGVASVFTNPNYRRLGMANFLLRKLQEVMDKQSAACSVLYSDIGKLYYTNMGWNVFPHQEASLTLLNEGKKLDPESCCTIKTRWLALDEIRQLCDLDIADLKQRLQNCPADGKIHLAFSPNFAQLEQQFAAEETFLKLHMNTEVERRGATTLDGKSWITWVHKHKRQRLVVLRIVTTSPESEARRVEHIWALLNAAVAEASLTGLKSVIVWNPDEATTSGIKATSNAYENDIKVVFTERDGSIPSFRWQKDLNTSNTVWDDNYYYCWC
ncbi:hypothetical protein MGG_02658 [Pyricularia oryzae 70-15]|uniref:LYC1 C-terminal domain-containing protein n=3 Tax=Pyricularia oryzae TaxID=318829 RepID=G5EHG0_PYRO7|nr:uncharacterized protein MGG_02658 [Pyricularia oryzae 70-15]ELQ36286.1 hypothetical protein OOU_Y34scaffold00666g147 [Pyricularia oryzae Y34]KAI7929989.1 hypothetical protein M9X92_001107 [Pyricularia oryzae]EAQ70983.1 hypothetical protein MGCH7_ch7g390 [Pyricularia oryzae 70-15]EHA46378.1 hypothetical protein MGG_02658 [Pyricularia oryzae 70-15]KAI7930453.1 hypothetical protein M0657_001573 [Pyricularia oryzae]